MSEPLILVCPLPDDFIESLRLEKTSKIVKSICQTITTMPTKPCPEVLYRHVFYTSRDGESTNSLGSMLIYLSSPIL